MTRLLLLLLVPLLAGCDTLAYYTQSARGQLGVMAASRPAADVVADPDTPEPVRRRLSQLPAMRRFAVDQLGLPETDSFRLYADVQREALLWSLVAAPVDSLEPKEWCYPVVGCASYRGYFDLQDAQTHAAKLAGEGWDTAVLPVPAYSTLGWFSDPMPSTVIGWPLPAIAGLVFHELAHESLYLPGDSTFNESYATVIEQEGVRRWLQRYGNPEQRRAYALAEERRQALLALIEQTRAQLESVYETDIEHAQLLRQKAEILQALRERYLLMREDGDGFADHDRRFDRPFNNADIASFSTYHALVPAFRQILAQAGGDMVAFQAECRAIAAMQPGPREAFLQDLLDQSVGP